MYRYITIVLALIVCSAAKPAIIAPLTYGAPLYAGTSQVDIRSAYNGGYATSLGYTAPLAARIAAPVSPFAYTAPVARYASPALAASYGYAAPVAKYISPYAASPYAAPYAASLPYATAYGAPYSVAAPAAGPVLL